MQMLPGACDTVCGDVISNMLFHYENKSYRTELFWKEQTLK